MPTGPIHARSFLPFATALLAVRIAAAQATPVAVDAADVSAPLARYTSTKGERIVTRGDVALEMAFHLRRKDDGRAACTQLVKSELVRRAAKKVGVWPSPETVQQRWSELKAQLKAAGRDLEKEPSFVNTGEQVLLDYLAIDLAHEQIVRRELTLGADEEVSPAMLELWIKEAREREKIVDDPDQLPLGTAAKIGEDGIPLIALGMLLLRSSDRDELDKFVRQVVALDGIEQAARENGVEATPEDLQRELELRRTMADKDPRYGGLTFEQLLRAQGLTPEWLAQSRVFRAQTLQKKLIAKLHPRQQLLARLSSDREQELMRFGPRRNLAILFVRALDEPNAIVTKDFKKAEEQLVAAKKRIETEPFANVARIESEDPGTKMRGGDCGWIARKGRDLPEPVLAAAWTLTPGGVSDVVRGSDGCYLVKVLGVEPNLDDDAIIARMREALVEDFTKDLMKRADIRRANGEKLDGEDPKEAGK